MKRKNNLLIAGLCVMMLAVGFFVGNSVDFPRVQNGEIAGTIGKVNNYRNAKASEADIMLKNSLLADTARQKAIVQYLNFYYVRAIALGANIDYSIKEAKNNSAFQSQNLGVINALENYASYMETARKDLLVTRAICSAGKKVDAVILNTSLKQANNIVAQMNYRNNTVMNFISLLDDYLKKYGTINNDGLVKAHDLLSLNEIGTAIVTKDKLLTKYFEDKKLMGKDFKSPDALTIAYNKAVNKDIEQLKEDTDSEILNSSSGTFDKEQLQIMYNDSEVLGSRSMGYGKGQIFDSEQIFNTEILGAFALDQETLNGIGAFDSEVLGGVVRCLDAEVLGFRVGSF